MADRATIDDVAALARVSIKTVSRVVNNEPNVRPATRARVERAIESLDYQPLPSARSLAAQRSFLIGLLYDNPSASYVIGIQSGVLEACRNSSYQLLIHPCDYRDRGLRGEITALVRRTHLEGLILTPPLADMAGLLRALGAAGIAYVLVAPGRRASAARSIHTNDRSACAELTRHLASLGHRRIAFIAGHPDHLAVGTRYQGYLDGLRSARIPLDRALVAQGLNSFESGADCARALLSRRPRPTAIFAANDDMAAGAIAVAHEIGLSIPEDLSVAGFDDIPLARQVWPALTTIRQPIEQMAQRATQRLLANLRGQARTRLPAETVESTLVLRESTGPCRQQSR